MLRTFRIVIVFLVLCTFAKAEIFEQNTISLGAKYSRGNALGKDYDVGGININYFIFDGLGIGVEYESWMSSEEPRLEKIGLSTTYFIPLSEPIRPYIGGIYRRVFIESVYDSDVYGYRAGLSFSSERASIALGWSEERLSSCSGTQKCVTGYAEVLISISFSI